jgi:hypothetical protein
VIASTIADINVEGCAVVPLFGIVTFRGVMGIGHDPACSVVFNRKKSREIGRGSERCPLDSQSMPINQLRASN